MCRYKGAKSAFVFFQQFLFPLGLQSVIARSHHANIADLAVQPGTFFPKLEDTTNTAPFKTADSVVFLFSTDTFYYDSSPNR
jgi:hypothetical protein